MAFKTVGRSGGSNESTTGDAIRVTQMAVGEVLEGYITRLIPKEENVDHANIIMKVTSTGELKMVFTAGNLAYAAGKDALLTEGLLTRITREEDYSGTSKAGKKYTRTQFKIEQDPDSTLENADFNAIFEPGPSEVVAAKSSAASRAAALSKSVTGKR